MFRYGRGRDQAGTTASAEQGSGANGPGGHLPSPPTFKAAPAALARYLSLAGVPQALAAWAAAFTSSPSLFSAALFGLLPLGGLIADTITMIAILTPIMPPAARQLGAGPLLMGLIFIISREAGFLTPPFGGNLFIVIPLAQVDMGAVSRAVRPYVAVVALMGLVLILWPALGLWLPGLFR